MRPDQNKSSQLSRNLSRSQTARILFQENSVSVLVGPWRPSQNGLHRPPRGLRGQPRTYAPKNNAGANAESVGRPGDSNKITAIFEAMIHLPFMVVFMVQTCQIFSIRICHPLPIQLYPRPPGQPGLAPRDLRPLALRPQWEVRGREDGGHCQIWRELRLICKGRKSEKMA